MARLLEQYRNEIAPNMQKQFAYKSTMEIPRLVSATVNMGVGEGARDKKQVEAALRDLEAISGQKAVCCKARRSIAGFKIRTGMPIGAKVTLRSLRMYEFIDRLINMALPRVRDFRGLDPVFDGRGNYSLGIKEQTIFYEIHYDTVDRMRSMQITFVTTAKTDAEAQVLLKGFGFPFKKKEG